jgi:Ca2+-binding RTX toxin-like protein
MTLACHRGAVAAITAALTALGAPAASAGTIADEVETVFGTPLTRVQFTAADGEPNSLEIAEAGDSFSFRDATAPLVASGRCTSADGGALCPAELDTLGFSLGDGDDRLTMTFYAFTFIDAGPGADVVSTGDGWDTIDGGEGDDQLSAGGGEAPGLPDTGDQVSYAERTAGVVVDLAAGAGGAAGERDVLSGFESASGGSGDDRVLGSGAANTLSGLRGDDVLVGRGNRDQLWGSGGDDTLRGGPGRDELSGGAGADRLEGGADNDTIRADDGRHDADVIDCGPGSRDVVWIDRRVDRQRNCEKVVRN